MYLSTLHLDITNPVPLLCHMCFIVISVYLRNINNQLYVRFLECSEISLLCKACELGKADDQIPHIHTVSFST